MAGAVRAAWRRLAPLYGDAVAAGLTVTALAAIVVALTGAPAWAAMLCALPAWLAQARSIAVAIRDQTTPAIRGVFAARMLLAVLPASLYLGHGPQTVLTITTITLLALLPVAEPMLARVLKGQRLGAAHLPGVALPSRTTIPVAYMLVINHLVLAIGIAVTALSLGISIALSAAVIAILVVLIALVDAARYYLHSAGIREAIGRAIGDYRPRFVLYYTAPPGSEYQVAMWLPYLEQIGERFVVVLRNWNSFSAISALTSAPVVVRERLQDLDDVAVPSVAVAFYVNNGATNTHFVRYAQITHIQLLHGDSDKAPSFNPVTAMFDRIYVAGQAGIDRYADHGIHIPRERFEIVGRPQVEAVHLRGPGNIPVRAVLYAPTWEGYRADTNYTSLHHGPEIVAHLLRCGLRVIFRPHPLSYRNPSHALIIRQVQALLADDGARTGTTHLWGDDAEKSLTLFECFNQVDAMVSDVSSVVGDFLYSGKPFALTMPAARSVDEFEREYPLARAGYLLQDDLSNLGDVMDEVLTLDGRAAARARMRTHYLGPFPGETYAEAFLTAARRDIVANTAARMQASRWQAVDTREPTPTPVESASPKAPAVPPEHRPPAVPAALDGAPLPDLPAPVV